LYSDTSFIDDYGSFSTEVIEMSHKKFNDTKVKFNKTFYTDENIITNSLIAFNKFGKKISDDLPKAFKLRLYGFFTQIDMIIILNASKEGITIDSDNDRNIYELPSNFIVTLCFLNEKKRGDPNMKETEDNFAFMRNNLELGDIFKKGTTRFDNTNDNIRSRINQDNWEFMLAQDIPVNVEELSKNIKPDKLLWYNFSIKLYHSHVNTKQKSESQRMLYGLKTVDKEKNLIIYCYNKELVTSSKGEQSYIVGYQPNVI
ncbi:2426_t:CDS:1, partial [Scutellospora calospora]